MSLKIGKSNSRQRFRYGRLSVDSDDQNHNISKQHDDINGSLLVNTKYPCDESTRIDTNGNTHVCSNHDEVCDNLNNNCNDSGIEKDEKTKSAEQKAVTRLQALAMSDDEDYGEYFWPFYAHGRWPSLVYTGVKLFRRTRQMIFFVSHDVLEKEMCRRSTWK